MKVCLRGGLLSLFTTFGPASTSRATANKVNLARAAFPFATKRRKLNLVLKSRPYSSTVRDKQYGNVVKVRVHSNIPVVISSEWSEFVTPKATSNFIATFDENTETLDVTSVTGEVFEMTTPERINLDISNSSGNIELKGKIEGDIKIDCQEGDVILNKARGEVIAVKAKGKVAVSSNIEGSRLSLTSNVLYSKRLMGDTVYVNADDSVDIISAYTQEMSIVSKGKVTLGSVHGTVITRADRTKINGMNGSIHAECNSDLQVFFDTLSNDSKSVLKTISGDVLVSIPEVSDDTPSGLEIKLKAHNFQDPGKQFQVASRNESEISLRPVNIPSVQNGSSMGSGKINVVEASKEIYGGQKTKIEAQIIEIEALEGTVVLQQLSWMDRIKSQFLSDN
mmetsp:Transcript_8784/g.10053  ORF Transcript_8784/g.10053 Transcript_8784/m.10053 type:complete len:394 (-) Transcript_8784:273-1454(-)